MKKCTEKKKKKKTSLNLRKMNMMRCVVFFLIEIVNK